MTARITPIDPATAQGQTKEMLTAVKSKFGMVPNGIKTMAHSPALLGGYLGLSGALGRGELPARIREQLALSISQTNSCEYCLAAHTLTGKMAGLKPEEIVAAPPRQVRGSPGPSGTRPASKSARAPRERLRRATRRGSPGRIDRC